MNTMMEKLQQVLSPKDFERMIAWIGGMPDDERTRMMEFIDARETRAPKVGDPAPDFDLPRADGTGRVRLSSFRGAKPVALVFGSYT